MTKICSCSCLLLTLLACGADRERGGELQLKLPKGLKEISGLAQLPDGSLLAIADEKAHVYRIDVLKRDAGKFAKFGDPVAKGDFEGIAVLDGYIYIVSSNGKLWRRRFDAPAQDYERFDTGIGKSCEVEGLSEWPEQNSLLIVCKSARRKSLRGRLTVFAWSATNQELLKQPAISKPFKDMGLPDLSPSGVTFSADRKRLFFVAAREQYFFETDLQGNLVRGGKFPFRKTHQQTEGVVITRENTLYLADEGGKERGKLTRYEPSF